MSSSKAQHLTAESGRNDLVAALGEYREMWSPREAADGAEDARSASALVSRYYDIVTPFYEYAWGTSFHFSPRHPGERLAKAQRRHEEGIGRLLDLKPGMMVADIGCGVGGPLKTIAKATGAGITGLNNNAYQIERGERMLSKAGLEKSCSFLMADFMAVPLPDGHFDAAYSFDAICHAPDIDRLFGEVFRLLRPGGEIAVVDWTMTEQFDETERRHRDVKARIELGNGCPNLRTAQEQVDSVKAAGFEILDCMDQTISSDPRTPWYMSLQGHDLSFSSLARVPAGRAITARATRVMEWLRILPGGTSEAARLLNQAADALVEGGELGIFTPSFLIHAHKA